MQGGPSRAAAWIATPLEEPPAPKFAYLASSWRSCAPSWHQDATASPKISKKTPSWSQHLPTQLPKPSQDSLLGRFYTSAIFPMIAKKVTKNAPSTTAKAAKLSPRWPSWRHHGPSWAQLAANLAHLASILGPSSPQLRQKSPPNPQEAPPDTPRRPRGSPEGSRTVPGA